MNAKTFARTQAIQAFEVKVSNNKYVELSFGGQRYLKVWVLAFGFRRSSLVRCPSSIVEFGIKRIVGGKTC